MSRLPHPPFHLLRDPGHFLSFGFGSGYLPRAPGTYGTLAAIPVWWLLSGLSLELYVLALLAVSVAGVWLCGRTADALGVHDHPAIVWDEIAGYLLTMLAAPPGWLWPLAGFVFFRIFDILKPWPIRVLDRELSGGLGIMLDDLLAGVFAALCLQALHWGLSYVA